MRFEIFFHLVKAGEPIKINNFNEYPRKGVTLCLLPAKNLEEVHTIAQVADNPLHLMMIQTHYLLALNVNDVGAIFEDLRGRQGTLGKRLVRRKRKEIAEHQADAPDRNSATLHPGR